MGEKRDDEEIMWKNSRERRDNIWGWKGRQKESGVRWVGGKRENEIKKNTEKQTKKTVNAG